jgi:acyl-CoA synthetase (AMP-forming)/AMP-acid ligase II/acyl carrier protein
MQTIPSQLKARADAAPDATATEVIGGERLTFSQWERRSNAVAHGLRERGVNRGAHVLLPCDVADWIEYAIAYVATQKAGAVAVPVSTRLGPSHVDWAARASGAVAVVSREGPPAESPTAWSATIRELEGDQPESSLRDVVAPGDAAEILYTSGTTGVAKGVVASHANLLATHASEPTSRPRRVVLHALPPATTVGQGLLLQPLNPSPHCVLTLPRFDDRAFLAAIEARRPVEVVLVPALALSLIRAAREGSHDLTSVELVRTTSAAIPPAALVELDALFPNAATINMYASTETWPARTRMRFDPARPDSVGRPAGGSRLRVADHEGRVLGPGVPGDVQLQLAGAPARSYDGDPDATAAVFLPGGWVRTGDIGYVDEDGYLYLVDRHADLVNSGGLNVSTLEVEAALHEHPDVVEAAAFGVPHQALGEYVAAAVRTAGDLALSDLHAFAEQRLGPRAPRRLVVVDELPRNAVGKVVKRALREELADELTGSGAGDAPDTPTERALAGLWREALGVDDVRRDHDFLDLGGTSLTAMEVTGRIREELGRQITQRDVFEATTLAELAHRVEAAPAAAADPRPRLERVARASDDR